MKYDVTWFRNVLKCLKLHILRFHTFGSGPNSCVSFTFKVFFPILISLKCNLIIKTEYYPNCSTKFLGMSRNITSMLRVSLIVPRKLFCFNSSIGIMSLYRILHTTTLIYNSQTWNKQKYFFLIINNMLSSRYYRNDPRQHKNFI